MNIANKKLNNNLIMAPMAGITDMPFRMLAKEGGAGLVCTEMISGMALVQKDKRTTEMLQFSERERPISVQIFGSNPQIMEEAAKIVEDKGFDIIDINFGCPVRKILKSGAGAKLIEDEDKMAKIMYNVSKAVKIPTTAKIRIGLKENENLAPHLVHIAQESGIKAITIHARPASAGHKGEPDLDAIAQAVEKASIPIIGNGGITDELSAQKFLKLTGCAGLMIGRAAIGDTNIFNRIEIFFKTGIAPKYPSWEERIELLKKHINMASAHYGEKIGIIRLRKIAPYYLKGLPNATKVRNEFNKITSIKELESILSTIWQSPYFE